MSAANSTGENHQVKSIEDLAPVKSYLNRIGAKVVSMLKAIVEAPDRKYNKEVATILFERNGEFKLTRKGVTLPPDHESAPTITEIEAIKAAFAGVSFPTSCACEGALPRILRALDDDHCFPIYDRAKRLVAAVQRIDSEDGLTKTYRTWSFWSDGEWRMMEPEGLLPIYNAHLVESGCAVMIHEGPKAAKGAAACAKQTDHPWYDFLRSFIHVGWHGGAERAHDTDWRQLAIEGVRSIVISPDNDTKSYKAIPEISRRLPSKVPVKALRWPAYFKESWDMADEIPYIDPEKEKPIHDIYESLEPATWATTLVGYKNPEKETGPIYVARDAFCDQWKFIALEKRFVHAETPRLRMDTESFDNFNRRFSHVDSLSKLVMQKVEMFLETTYLPGEKVGRVGKGDNGQTFNTYTPGKVRPRKGDIKPWLKFLERLIPDKEEREFLEDWLATLLARPQNRPGCAVLLYSIMHGTGKGTLMDIIDPIVGPHNCSYPSADEMVESQFNSWLAYKTLVHCPEIYQGHSWKAANSLKAAITDKKARFNEKHEVRREIPASAWFLLNSNSSLALKLEHSDRRWFVPGVSEIFYTKEEAAKLREWADKGGRCAIFYWAMNYEKITGRCYLTPGTKAPDTARKRQMIESSVEDDVQAALDVLQAAAGWDEEKQKYKKTIVFSISQLLEIAQRDIPSKDKMSAQVFYHRMAENQVFPFGRMRVGEDKNLRRFSYVGDRPATNSDAVGLFVNLEDFA